MTGLARMIVIPIPLCAGLMALYSLVWLWRVIRGEAALEHLIRVASGLDSMVLGESQILGQLKDAVRAASASGALGTTLNQMFQRSFAVA